MTGLQAYVANRRPIEITMCRLDTSCAVGLPHKQANSGVQTHMEPKAKGLPNTAQMYTIAIRQHKLDEIEPELPRKHAKS
jgi:hypothetical protein